MMTAEFTPLYVLYGSGKSPGTLATAIEKAGIYGWDRYGRFKHFKPNEPEVHLALDALAWQARHEDDPDSPSPMFDEGINALSRFGWPANEQPDFAAIEAGALPAPERPHVNQKSENSTLAIVGSLLAFIKGELGTPPHPEFASEAQLIVLLAQQCRGYHGMSARNLQDKFAAAKKLLESS